MFASRPFGPYLAYLDLTFADLEPVWGHLGARLGYLGPISAPSWASVAPLLGYLGQSWGCLGVMLGHLQLIWKASWAILCHLRAPFHLIWPVWAHLGPSWSHLRPIFAHVGLHWGQFRSLLYTNLGPMLEHLLRSVQPQPANIKRGGGGASPQAFSINRDI